MPRTTIRTDDVNAAAAIAQSKLATIAADALSGNMIDGGTISNFASTGIDDNADAVAVTITSAEKVGINKTDPGDAYLYVKDKTTSAGSISPNANMQMTLEGGTDAGINIFGGNNSSGRIIFGCQDTDYGGAIRYNQNDDEFFVYVNSTSNDQSGKDALRIQSNTGTLLKQMCTYQATALSDNTAVTWTPPRPCLLYTSPSPRDLSTSRMPSSA